MHCYNYVGRPLCLVMNGGYVKFGFGNGEHHIGYSKARLVHDV